MTRVLRPVLTVDDPAAALDWFARLPGVTAAAREVRLGRDAIAICAPGDAPAGLHARPFDHLALHAPDVDATLAAALTAGAALHPGFTPDGPQEIAAFWETGVRYAFVTGPGGVAVEFCARRGESGPAGITGLDHLGLRVPDSAAAAAGLLAAGAVTVAGWQVGRVDVRFLRQDNLMWEVFDEPPVPETPGRWAGVAPG